MQRHHIRFNVTQTRVGILLDHLLDVTKKYPKSFTRQQFMKVMQLSSSSTSDKLKDMETLGLVSRSRDKTGTRFTQDAIVQTIMKGQPESAVAIEKIVRRISLWNKLLTAVGKTPERSNFEAQVKIITGYDDKQLSEDINWLWYAYTEDISCISGTPPYSKWSEIFGKTNQIQDLPITSKKMSMHAKETITLTPEIPQKPSIVEPITEVITEQPVVKPPQLILHKPIPKYGVIEYKGHRFEINDDLTYVFADQIMKKIKKDLESNGVKFEP